MANKTLDFDMAKEIKRDKFYSPREIWSIAWLSNFTYILIDRRTAGLFEEDEIHTIQQAKRTIYYYKWTAVLRVFFGIDVNNPKHLELIK
jgi:hypothetical protein